MSMVLGPCTWGRQGQGPVEGPPPTCGQTDRQTGLKALLFSQLCWRVVKIEQLSVERLRLA